MKFVLSPRWTINYNENKKIVFTSENLEYELGFNGAIEVFNLINKGPFDVNKIPKNIEKFLLEKRVIVNAINFNEKSKIIDRQYEYWRAFTNDPDSVIKKLTNSHVLILGVGGVGSIVLQILAGSGVKNFTLIDSDTVDRSNFNRQYIYKKIEIEEKKVNAAKKWLLERHDNLSVKVLTENYPSKNINHNVLKNANFIVSAFDQPNILNPINLIKESWDLKIPSSLAMTGFDKGLISPIFDIQQNSANPYESYKITDQMINRPPIKASSGAYNSLISSILAEQILFHLSGLTDEVDYEKFTIINRFNGSLSLTKHSSINL